MHCTLTFGALGFFAANPVPGGLDVIEHATGRLEGKPLHGEFDAAVVFALLLNVVPALRVVGVVEGEIGGRQRERVPNDIPEAKTKITI